MERPGITLLLTAAGVRQGGVFRDTGVVEKGENERQSETDCEIKTVS